MPIEQSKLNALRRATALAVVALCAATAFGHQSKREDSRGVQSPDKKTRLSPESRVRIRQAIAAVGLLLVRNGGDDPEPRPRGSAVVVRSDGLVVTNSHVITDARSARLYDEIFFVPSSNAQSPAASNAYRLKSLIINRSYDLALLRIESDRGGKALSRSTTFPAIEMGDSKSIELLEDLIVVGYPEKGGATVTLSAGFVEGKDTIRNWIKTDARVIHGNSGGAAVNSEGKLIGIPTKVEADVQPVDSDGDGSPEGFRRYGAVGFLRPAHLVAGMIAELANPNAGQTPDPPAPKRSEPKPFAITPQAPGEVTVRGVVRSQTNSKPIAGALVGVLPLGTTKVTEENLLAWGNTNTTGQFSLNNSIPPGRYTLKATAIGHAPYSREIEITQDSQQIVIEMRPPPNQ
ncbi:MAG TPA: trypsin-like peptidase domain-containing protein [Blastocatellia bacterium]|jgi:S1-C subfamily serine protease|nr:trypsin-like peptidase domain-containing protein [Blastocatellia bacterium]